MNEDAVTRAPAAGVVYGGIAYWLLLAGMVIAALGLAMYMKSGGYIDSSCLLDRLWGAYDVDAIWKECAKGGGAVKGHWYLDLLKRGDGVAMLGISVSCMAAVFGVWGASFTMMRGRQRRCDDVPRLYLGLSLAISMILTLSLLGVISL